MNASGVAKYALLSAASGALAGAIGAATASGRHPIWRGTLITGAVGGTLALVRVALVSDPNAAQIGTSGPPRSFPRFV